MAPGTSILRCDFYRANDSLLAPSTSSNPQRNGTGNLNALNELVPLLASATKEGGTLSSREVWSHFMAKRTKTSGLNFKPGGSVSHGGGKGGGDRHLPPDVVEGESWEASSAE